MRNVVDGGLRDGDGEGRGGLLVPWKTIGVYGGGVPLQLRAHASKRELSTVLVAVDAAVHQYNALSLRLVSVSDALPRPISCLAASSSAAASPVFASFGSNIALFHYCRQIERIYDGEKAGHKSPIRSLLMFANYLVSVDEDSVLLVWNIATHSFHTEFAFSNEHFRVTALCHPATYLDKLLVGSDQGPYRLLNLRDGRMIHEFAGWDGVEVSALQQSPAIDVVAVGLADGHIHLQNIKFDETLFSFRQDWTPVSQIAFRNDGVGETMVSCGGKSGHLAVWDLEKRRLVGQMTGCHSSAIGGLAFVEGEALMVSNADDNAVKNWLFDKEDGLARLLAVRDGHALPITCLRFLRPPNDPDMVLSSSLDGSLRAFSCTRETKVQHLGHGCRLSKKKSKMLRFDFDNECRLPPISEFVGCELGGPADWDNVVCRHVGCSAATCWSVHSSRMGQKSTLSHPRFESRQELLDAFVSACSISACSNFALVAYSTGHVDLFNIQSAIHRGVLTDAELKSKCAHSAQVTGIDSDSLNRLIVTCCANGWLKFWRFKSKALFKSIHLSERLSMLRLNRDNNLAAVVQADSSIAVVDTRFQKVVRLLNRPANRRRRSLVTREGPHLTDVAFDAFGRWLCACDTGGGLKVWELSGVQLIEAVQFEQPCRRLAFSEDNHYLATAHKGSKGIHLWLNRRFYQPNLVLKALPMDAAPRSQSHLFGSLPDGHADDEKSEVAESADTNGELNGMEMEDNVAQQLDNLLTLSDPSTSRWIRLPNLVSMRQRNRPKEPPKKSKLAPFFLPSVASVDGFVFKESLTNAASKEDKAGEKTAFHQQSLDANCELDRRLFSAKGDADFANAFAKLKSSSLSAVHSQLSQLTATSPVIRLRFLKMLFLALTNKRDFDFVQAFLATFLRLHRQSLLLVGEEHTENQDTEREEEELLKQLLLHLGSVWSNTDGLLISCSDLMQWFKSALL